MENPKYILVMRQVASDYDGISHELFQIANDLERMDQFNPQQKLFNPILAQKVCFIWGIAIILATEPAKTSCGQCHGGKAQPDLTCRKPSQISAFLISMETMVKNTMTWQ